MASAYLNNMWVLRYPEIRDFLSNYLASLREEYFTDEDGVISGNYEAFFSDILQAHNDLYADSIPCRALFNNDNLKAHQKAVKHYNTIDSYLREGGKIQFRLHGWGNDEIHGVNILSIRVRNENRERWVEWDTTGMTWLPERIGFDKMQNIVTDISTDDARYNIIRDALREELAKGWTGEEGKKETWMRPVHEFAVICRGLNDTIKRYIPDSTNKERAEIIMGLFKFYVDPSKFAEMLNNPQ